MSLLKTIISSSLKLLFRLVLFLLDLTVNAMVFTYFYVFRLGKPYKSKRARRWNSTYKLLLGIVSFVLSPIWLPFWFYYMLFRALFLVTRKLIVQLKQTTNTHNQLTQSPTYFTQSITELRNLAPIEFEEYIGAVFRKKGFHVESTPASGDGGVDLFISKDTTKGIVQCKRYKGTVGEPAIRDLFGTMRHNKVDIAYLITTGKFSKSAINFAHGKPIVLLDSIKLSKWINTVK